MKKTSQKFQHESQNQTTQIVSTLKLTGKDLVNAPHAFYQQKSSQHNEQTNIPHQDLNVIRVEGNKLWCKELSTKIPSTPSGDVDWVQLEKQIASRKRFYPLKQYQ